jgi:VWFA-related protein
LHCASQPWRQRLRSKPQSPPVVSGPETPAFHAESRLVSLDVVVTDAKGNPVPGLTRSDFTVSENGVDRPLRDFDSWQHRPAVPDEPVFDKYGRPEWGSSPLAILVLDEFSTTFEDSAYAAQMLKRYLRAEPAKLPVPTMLMVVSDTGYRALVGLTRDREALLHAVDARPPVIPARLSRGDSDAILVQTFLILQQIALANAGLQQHKSILWVGTGFDGVDPESLDETSEASLKKAIHDTVNLLMDTHTTVYKIDPTPSTTSTQPEVDMIDSLAVGSDSADAIAQPEDPLKDNFNFNSFAVMTGGQYFYGQNDLDRYFRHAIDETDEFYTMTYVPPASDADEPETYRHIVVKTNRPGLRVTTRQGYYSNTPPAPQPTSTQLGFAIASVALGDMNFTGVGLRGTERGSGPEARHRQRHIPGGRSLTRVERWTKRHCDCRCCSGAGGTRCPAQYPRFGGLSSAPISFCRRRSAAPDRSTHRARPARCAPEDGRTALDRSRLQRPHRRHDHTLSGPRQGARSAVQSWPTINCEKLAHK